MSDVLFISFSVGLVFFCFYMWQENQKLKDTIKKLKENTIQKEDYDFIKDVDQDTVSIQKLSKSQKELKRITDDSRKEKTQPKKIEYIQTMARKEPRSVSESVNSNCSREDRKTIPEPKKKDAENQQKNFSQTSCQNVSKTSIGKPYQKNQISNQPKITSPVSISNDIYDMKQLTLDLNELIKKKEKIVPIIQEHVRETSPDYLKKISEQMAEQLKSQAIELTDYEKEQEEQAIISYQELLSVRDRLALMEDDEGTVDFIEELKKFRDHLE